jgi:hypothetical protein
MKKALRNSRQLLIDLVINQPDEICKASSISTQSLTHCGFHLDQWKG